MAWRASGLPYGDAEKFVNLLAAKVHIESCEVETAYEALKKAISRRRHASSAGPIFRGIPIASDGGRRAIMGRRWPTWA